MNNIKANKQPLRVPVSRRQLAMYYFPSPTPESSVRRLARWLEDDPTLLHALEEAGYYKRKKWFTRAQLQVFVDFFGE